MVREKGDGYVDYLWLLAYISKQGLDLERQRWRAETALRESEEKYRLLVEGTTEGVLLVVQDRPVYANRTLLSRHGRPAPGRSCQRVGGAGERPRLHPPVPAMEPVPPDPRG